MFNTAKKIAMLLVLTLTIGAIAGFCFAEEIPAEVEQMPAPVVETVTEAPAETKAAPEATETLEETPAAEATETLEETPAAEATETLEETPAPVFNGHFEVRLVGEAVLGEKVTLRVVGENCEGDYSLQWQVRTAGGEWKNVQGENDETYEFVLDAENVNYEYRVEVTAA